MNRADSTSIDGKACLEAATADAVMLMSADASTANPLYAQASSPHMRRLKRWHKLALLVLLLAVLLQLPFIARRFQLQALHRFIQTSNAGRIVAADSNYREYVGVTHVHSSLGGHSTGDFASIIKAAQENRLDFVVMTEHTEADIDTAALTLHGAHGGVLFVNGNETKTATGDRLLVLPGAERLNAAGVTATEEFMRRESTPERSIFIAYPEEFHSWQNMNTGYAGIEVYNLFTNARRVSPLVMFFDWLWSDGNYGELLFARFDERPAANLQRWDETMAAQGRILTVTAGNDAHANIGVALQLASGEKLLGVQLDPYERSFRIVRVHVLLPQSETLTTDALLAALKRGRCFIAFDLFSDATGFRFTASDGIDERTMGDEINLPANANVQLRVRTPLPTRIILFRDGAIIDTRANTTATNFNTNLPGIYRVEAYLEGADMLRDKPWIISNPIILKR